jgi:tetratricopeptide (TPR) repeat protein
MGLARDNFQLAQADLLMRNSDYGSAIELCQVALAQQPTRFMAASFEQILATAYSFVNDYDAAVTYGERALDGYLALGATDSASDAVIKLASDLASMRRDDAWERAEQMLGTWQTRDEQRGDVSAAVSKSELLVQITIHRYLYSPTQQGEPSFITQAEQVLNEAEAMAQRLPPREAALRVAGIHQMRGQIASLQQDEAGIEQAWLSALAIYEQAGLAMEAANARYILGVLHLNRANVNLMPSFGEAERMLNEALAYYDQAGMRTQSADTRFMLARLYTNASIRVEVQLGTQMLDAALMHLQAGEADYDAIRREYAVGSVLDAQRGKQALIQKGHRLYTLALEILLLWRPDALAAWQWGQRAKARALRACL